MPPPAFRKGRGTATNRAERFRDWTREALIAPVTQHELDQDQDLPPLRTEVRMVDARSILSRNQSPDVPFDQSINPYQGCEHGCVYCYARPSHAFLDLSPGLDFETRIFAKRNAATLLRAELARPGYVPRLIALGANTDPYQPLERRLGLTRAVLEVLAECRHPVGITTKSALVERDLDLLVPMAAQGLVRVFLSVGTLQPALARILEPRATAPARRIEAVRRLTAAGVPAGVIVAPLIPAINDDEIEQVLAAAAGAGACSAHYVLLRLPLEVRALFQEWLQQHYPLRAAHVMSLIRQMRGGRDNDARFGHRMHGDGELATLIAQRFRLAARRLGLDAVRPEVDSSRFCAPAPPARASRRRAAGADAGTAEGKACAAAAQRTLF
ncbi:MAG: PA0069 family radical SAM protein [Pseudomonadota bacterium]|nr:PA0069 family radical SAM protein [Pseudomonadota bacterium]